MSRLGLLHSCRMQGHSICFIFELQKWSQWNCPEKNMICVFIWGCCAIGEKRIRRALTSDIQLSQNNERTKSLSRKCNVTLAAVPNYANSSIHSSYRFTMVTIKAISQNVRLLDCVNKRVKIVIIVIVQVYSSPPTGRKCNSSRFPIVLRWQQWSLHF
jgi:hypothetical protein